MKDTIKEFIYLCGPTVYNKVHIGNMRPIVTFDLALRGMKYLNNNIIFIHNITDIDDKIITQAIKEEISELSISEKYYNFYLQILKEFNVQTIDIMPKVTKHINDIEKCIEKMIDNNYAYKYNDSIYFDTKKINEYGCLSNIKVEELISQNQIEKHNSFDFALWKNKTKGKNWSASFGIGRPGWHTECATFIDKYTNHQTLKIHGGGIDLKFPHHENENAQYLALNDKKIADKWIHIGIINFQNQKMSKSLGNIIYADEFIQKYNEQTNSADLFRLLILSSSINSTIELNEEIMNSLIKKMQQIEKIINYILLNEIEIVNSKETLEFLAHELSNFSFSNITKTLYSKIKKFNELKDRKYAISVFQIISFLGFNVANKKISKDDLNLYINWTKLVKQKQYVEADEIRTILIQKKLI